MTIDDITYIGQQAMIVTLLAAAPMLIAGMVVGLVISVLQSVTQIQEITLTFVPKIIAVMVAFVVFLPLTSEVMLDFVRELFDGINLYITAR
ncbi:MAG TPA: flagellar biosynthesis protein FliQ [Candidatus Hydrogenedentes bacterium]|nr:flagellar biosynthesis protein FliQ [Candidatus Hydrogenedentota bacterium]HNT86609.1 flagellar biosynthesis protein FliQ [Candidatus Hydrogenedentota bacterium]